MRGGGVERRVRGDDESRWQAALMGRIRSLTKSGKCFDFVKDYGSI